RRSSTWWQTQCKRLRAEAAWRSRLFSATRWWRSPFATRDEECRRRCCRRSGRHSSRHGRKVRDSAWRWRVPRSCSTEERSNTAVRRAVGRWAQESCQFRGEVSALLIFVDDERAMLLGLQQLEVVTKHEPVVT